MRANGSRAVVGGALVMLLLGAGHGLARAEEPRPAWAGELEALRAEAEPLKRVERLLALLEQKPAAPALLTELSRPHPWKADAKVGMTHWERQVAGAGTLTVFAYVPTGYTPEKAWPALVWLHGGVGTDRDGGGLHGLGLLREEAEAKGVLLVCPSATKDCPWWSPRGVAHVRASLRDLAATWRVDPARVAVGGFSDGASGGFHLLAHDPDPYGCVLSLMGNPVVTRALGGPAFAVNCASLPVFALNGGQDGLYPSERMKPLIEDMTQRGARITWVDAPEAGHDTDGLGAHLDAIWGFWKEHPRVALPAKLDWECAVPALDGRRAWLEILEVDPAAPGAPGLESQALDLPPQAAPRPRLGIGLDVAFAGPGIKIERVEPGSPAAEAGLRVGDVLVQVGETPLGSGEAAFKALRAYIEGLGTGEGTFGVKRGEEVVTLRTQPRLLKQDEPPAGLGYGKPSGRAVAEVLSPQKIEVRTRGVRSLRLHLARPLIDTTREVVVLLNGKEAWKGVPTPEAAYVLGEALRALPGDPLYEATVTLRP